MHVGNNGSQFIRKRKRQLFMGKENSNFIDAKIKILNELVLFSTYCFHRANPVFTK